MCPALDELRGIVRLPRSGVGALGAEIAAKGLLAPRALRWVGNGRKR